ncbi:sigma-54 interaction domain-containing protein [Alkalimarinus coralli]|uniref:sigma-54 interaction domain-containing protein n=1 Tax=Alkalimarinus coralli TaxID=2935863 RepID=UPI00202B2F4C|nr:sigma-54 dependent transcriptional regulator [Alkalimarinus coralli]
MKAFSLKNMSSASYGGLIEKIEVLRSSIRFTPGLTSEAKQTLNRQVAELREELMLLSRKERADTTPLLNKARAQSKKTPKTTQTTTYRRESLLERNFVFEGVFGDSPKLLDAFEIAEKAAPTNLPVLIEGESGTGKELMAKVVHANGKRSDKPFVSVNCGAIPENLLESELFGHKKGAFTGASSDRSGKFESANTGTIFLDEIGEMPLIGQVKLLRVLQANEIQRVGSDEITKVDTRIVAATNRDLLKMSQEGTFREDLYYRLGVIHVTLPALRERKDEISVLIEYFCDEAAESLERRPINISPTLYHFLQNYQYPGNIRELRNIIYRLSCLADETAEIYHLPEAIKPKDRPESTGKGAEMSLADIKKAASDDAEKHYLKEGLKTVNGKVSALAAITGMNRSYLQTLLKKHGIHSKEFKRTNKSNEPE